MQDLTSSAISTDINCSRRGNKNEKIQTLSKEENSLMKKIAEKWKNKNTNEIVNFTHNQLPYFLCRDDELIPYELITQEDANLVY